MSITVSIPRPVRHPNRRNYAAPFEQWLGYRLDAVSRRVITALEQQRLRNIAPRLYLCDNAAHTGRIQKLLTDYSLFLIHTHWQDSQLCIVGVSRQQVNTLLPRKTVKSLPQGRWQAVTATARTPEYTRGLNFDIALMLDADRYPRRGRHMSRVWASVLPGVNLHPRTMVVVHGTVHPRMRVNTFTNRARLASDGHFDWQLLDLSLPPDTVDTEPQPATNPPPPLPAHIIASERIEFRLFPYALRHPYEVTLS